MKKALLVLFALTAAAFSAQDAPPPGPGPGRGGMPAPRNLKIIKPEEIRPVMESFVAGTGLECMDCHVGGDFGSDEKEKKLVARKMLEMVRGVNASTFNGAAKVTCYTCHRGEAHPKSSAK